MLDNDIYIISDGQDEIYSSYGILSIFDWLIIHLEYKLVKVECKPDPYYNFSEYIITVKKG